MPSFLCKDRQLCDERFRGYDMNISDSEFHTATIEKTHGEGYSDVNMRKKRSQTGTKTLGKMYFN